MNDEIKEHMQNCIDREESCLLNSDNTKILLDYITNLQQENERLRIKCDLLTGKKIVELDKKAKQIKIKAIEQQDYKSRIEKAVEYLKEHSQKTDLNIYGIENVLSFRGSVNDLLNILNGRSDE